jgi:hypothetical protein
VREEDTYKERGERDFSLCVGFPLGEKTKDLTMKDIRVSVISFLK